MNNINASAVVLVIGLGILLASLLADVIGIGDDVGFGNQQTLGTLFGVLVIVVGAYLMMREKNNSNR